MISTIMEKLNGIQFMNNCWFRCVLTVSSGIGALFCIKVWLSSKRKKCTNKISLHGKTCIVTGANCGIGRAVALELARRKAHVILACRNTQKGSKAALKIRKMCKGQVKVSVYELDLSSFQSIRRFVFEINKESIDIDVLVNNAGVLTSPNRESTDGFEMHFAVNHLGHFLLTNLLLPQMKNKEDARIIVVASGLYKSAQSGFLFDYENKKCYSSSQGYARSKLCNILFCNELSKRLPKGISINSMHPGMVKTQLARHRIGNYQSLKYLFKMFGYLFLRTPEEGAQTIIHMITEPSLKSVSGKYFGDCQFEEVLPIAKDDNVSERLWEMSERFTGL